MAKDVAVQNHAPRERHLNIVYFVDSARTHSIRVNLSHARWVLAGAVGLTIWAVMSLAWILSLGRILDTTRNHLSTALASVFDYQVKYDKIFDVAYPDASLNGYYAEGSHLSANNPTTTNDVRPAEKPAAAVAVKEAAVPAMATSVTAVGQPAAATAVVAPPTSETAAVTPAQASAAQSSVASLDIRKPLLKKSGDKLSLEFDMINRETKNKSEGYVWAIVNVKLADGSQKSIVAPTSARLNKTGSVDNHASAYRFSIQRYKKKEFGFILPTADESAITEVKIVYSDLSGKDRHESIVPPVIDKSEPVAEEKDPSP